MGMNLQKVAGGWWCIVFCALALNVHAQGTTSSGGSPGLFSAPASGGLQLPGTMPAVSSSHFSSGNQIEAPHSIFGQPDDSPDIQPPPPQIQMNALQQMMLERQKNWAQMTPEEIFGLKAPDKSTDSTKTESDGTYHSPLEKFLMEQRLVQTGTTNLNHSVNEGWNFLDPETGLPNSQRVDAMRNGSIVGSQIFNRWLDNAGDNRNQQNQDDEWARVFTSPQQDIPTPSQDAEMQAFRQLLDPSAPAAGNGNGGPGSKSRSFLPAIPAVDPDLNPVPAGFNPVGSTFAPLQSTMGRPNGINPLPGVVNLPLTVQTPPSWAPQPAPWASGKPQLFVTPQRKF